MAADPQHTSQAERPKSRAIFSCKPRWDPLCGTLGRVGSLLGARSLMDTFRDSVVANALNLSVLPPVLSQVWVKLTISELAPGCPLLRHHDGLFKMFAERSAI